MIVGKKRRLISQRCSGFLAPDVETAQTLGQMPRNIRYGNAPPATIGIGQIAEQFRRCASKRHLKMERERFFIESCHADMRTNIER